MTNLRDRDVSRLVERIELLRLDINRNQDAQEVRNAKAYLLGALALEYKRLTGDWYRRKVWIVI